LWRVWKGLEIKAREVVIHHKWILMGNFDEDLEDQNATGMCCADEFQMEMRILLERRLEDLCIALC
jgi:hypothetical protein